MYYLSVQEILKQNSYNWLVTGAAGFIGSHIVENLLKLNQKVVGLDNFSTGFQHNLDDIEYRVGPKFWKNFRFIRGDIRDLEICKLACANIDYVSHQAALGSVPRSIIDPLSTHQNNVDGFFNILLAAKDANVKKIVFASSSSVYGDDPSLPKIENLIGDALSPYALSKYTNELYAEIFAKVYSLNYVGLRYFNVFGPRQNPNGAYAAVIPTWMKSMLNQEDVYINGDGQISRDFCFIDNAVQANIIAAVSDKQSAMNQIYNVACENTTTLNALFDILKDAMQKYNITYSKTPIYREERKGDIKHSFASTEAIRSALGYEPTFDVYQGILNLTGWFVNKYLPLEIL
jgi:UDP-N-acetylglucosamine 4-epimerase